MESGVKVYGIFQVQKEPPRYVIYAGTTAEVGRGMTTVDYGLFKHTHLDTEKDKIFFENLDNAENKLEEMRVKAWF